MYRDGIVDSGADEGAAQVRAQRVPVPAPDDVLVVDVCCIAAVSRRPQRQPGQTVVVTCCNCVPPGVVCGQVRQLGPEDRRLDRTEPSVDPGNGADITLAPAIFADFPER